MQVYVYYCTLHIMLVNTSRKLENTFQCPYETLFSNDACIHLCNSASNDEKSDGTQVFKMIIRQALKHACLSVCLFVCLFVSGDGSVLTRLCSAMMHAFICAIDEKKDRSTTFNMVTRQALKHAICNKSNLKTSQKGSKSFFCVCYFLHVSLLYSTQPLLSKWPQMEPSNLESEPV